MLKKKIRTGLLQLPKAFHPLRIPLFISSLYIFLFVYLSLTIGLWQPKFTFITLGWVFGTAAVLWINVHKMKSISDFKKAVKDHFQTAFGIGVLGIIIDLNVYSLLTEMIIIFFVSIIALLYQLTAILKSDKKVVRLLEKINAFVGISIFMVSIMYVVNNYNNIEFQLTFVGFILPLVYTIAFLPLLYSLSLYASYDTIFKQLNFWVAKRDKHLATQAKWEIIKKCNLNIYTVGRLSTDDLNEVRSLVTLEDLEKLSL